jgi:hypothetical protein
MLENAIVAIWITSKIYYVKIRKVLDYPSKVSSINNIRKHFVKAKRYGRLTNGEHVI